VDVVLVAEGDQLMLWQIRMDLHLYIEERVGFRPGVHVSTRICVLCSYLVDSGLDASVGEEVDEDLHVEVGDSDRSNQAGVHEGFQSFPRLSQRDRSELE